MQLSARSKFLVLVGVFASPLVAAYIAVAGWRPAGQSNYGDLLATTPLQRTAGVTLDGAPYSLASLHGKWIMVHVGTAACDAACARQLYLMRQARVAQGKDQSRIERLWVLTGSGEPDATLLRGHPGLRVWRPTEAAFVDQFPAAGTRSQHIYLIDPLGNLMLRFPGQAEFKGVMKDLKLLLAASHIG